MSIPYIDCKDLQTLLQSGKPHLLLDVRNAKDYTAGPQRIPGALKLDAEVIGQWAAMLPPEREVIVYCQHGKRLSNLAVEALVSRGYKARGLEGGLDAWLESKGAMTEG